MTFKLGAELSLVLYVLLSEKPEVMISRLKEAWQPSGVIMVST